VKRMLRPSLVLLGTAVALIGGGGVLAFAGWTSRSTSATFTVTAAKIPQIPRPTATRTIVPVITWKGVRIAPDDPVDRYVVTRHLGKATRIVCSQPATLLTKCVDFTAPPGSPFTYTVHATDGEYWVGADSEASPPLGSLLALDPSGTPIAPTVTATVVPATTEPVNPMMATDAPAPDPTAPVGLVPTATEEPEPIPEPTVDPPQPTEDADLPTAGP
jgi:hypothetical protein